jgi:ABC-type Fe3+ transport system permease subunit
LGLKGTILAILNVTDPKPAVTALEPADPLANPGAKEFRVTEPSWFGAMLYYGPSGFPVLWVDLIRFFPCAVAVIWPVLRLLPRELRDAAAVDGADPLRAFVRVVLPLGFVAAARAGLAVGVLSLGELSAGKLVSTPNWPTYAEMVFTQMHYGVTNDLAARCLLLLLAVGAGGVLVLALSPRAGRRTFL